MDALVAFVSAALFCPALLLCARSPLPRPLFRVVEVELSGDSGEATVHVGKRDTADRSRHKTMVQVVSDFKCHTYYVTNTVL